MEGWHDFFVAQAGAAVAFAGLVLVSISINLERIVKAPGLVGRSAEPLVILFSLFVASSLLLVPDQSTRAYGMELLGLADHLFHRDHVRAAESAGRSSRSRCRRAGPTKLIPSPRGAMWDYRGIAAGVRSGNGAWA